MDLSIIIVSWNVYTLLDECLESLVRTGVAGWAEVHVVDNASGDRTARMVAEKYPWVHLTALKENIGFSRANNLVIPKCRGNFIWLLNPDTVVYSDAASKLVNFAKSNPSIGIAGPKQFDAQGSVQYEAAVNLPTVWNVFCDWSLLSRFFPRSRLFSQRKMGYWDHLDNRAVQGIQGSAMLIRRDVFKNMDFLDTTMFMIEDMDLCYRAKKSGWEVYYLSDAEILHYGSASIHKRNAPGLLITIAFQSFWLYLRKHKGVNHARVLSIVFGSWAFLLKAMLPVLSVWFRLNKKQSGENTIKEIADHIWKWARCDKLQFTHSLADHPLHNERGLPKE